ncbi:MAG: hypothetical protein ACK501_09190 [Planctomycetota bacterium]
MELLSDDDMNLREMTREQLDKAWDLWFAAVQYTNDFDEPYSHGVFVGVDIAAIRRKIAEAAGDPPASVTGSSGR